MLLTENWTSGEEPKQPGPKPPLPKHVPASRVVVPPKGMAEPKPLIDKISKVDPSAQTRAEKLRSPREMLKTFYFAIAMYDLFPNMLGDAVLCMDLEDRDTPSAALRAIDLELILRGLEIPLSSVPDSSDAPGNCHVLHDASDVRISLSRHEDGAWRFDRDTLSRVPAMRKAMVEKPRPAVDKNLFREGFATPRETMRQFLLDALNGDFYSAARALDLNSLGSDQRIERGPILAQQLAFVIQRRGYIFFAEVPAQSTGAMYTWHADGAGRIALERVRQADGKDAWLFSRKTISNLTRLYAAVKDQPVDPRYARLGIIIPALPTTGTSVMKQKRYDHVPPHLGSPRAVLKGFFRAMDGSEKSDARLNEALEFLDLRGIPTADRATLAPKLASKLETVLRKARIDLSAVPDDWNASPFVAGEAQNLRIEITRGVDGCWRFSDSTLNRVQSMFDQLAEKYRSDRERSHQLESARDTVATFLGAVANNEFENAATCLDLHWLYPATREEIGPVLAYKLKYVLDRLGRLYIQEIPDDPTGPRVVIYRGEQGRIVLARRTEEPGKGNWLFTAETVKQIEPVFCNLIRQPVDESVEDEKSILRGTSLLTMPGIWVRLLVPDFLQKRMHPLEPYQWIGLVAAALLSGGLSYLFMGLFHRLVGWLLRLSGSNVSVAFVASKLRPLTWLATLWLFFQFAAMLDLPLMLANQVLPCKHFLHAVLIGWLGTRVTDLVLGIYTNSELLGQHRSLSDLVVPVSMRVIKAVIWLLVATYLVFQIGEGDLVGRFLTGLGVLGLAASLAAQDALKSFFGTLLLIGERTFKIGDRILVNGQEGVIEQVGFRATQLRTPDGSLLTMPNSTLASASIDNQGVRSFRRLRSAFQVSIDTPLPRLLKLRDQLHDWLINHPSVHKDHLDVYVQQITDKGIELSVNLTLTSAEKSAEICLRQDFQCEVLRLAESLGVSLAGATRKWASPSYPIPDQTQAA